MAFIELVTALQDLIAQLQHGGRARSAEFFLQHHAALSQHGMQPDSREILQQLASCSAMAQYADFSFAEEKLLHAVVDLARQLHSGETPP